MRVRSLFFAQYRDLAGADERVVELPAGASVGDLVRVLRAGDDGLRGLPAAPVTAVNMDYAPASTALADGDEVAFIPPVAGG
jgi:molybdopterin converting factor subunit 1